jgi:hypothetical protein
VSAAANRTSRAHRCLVGRFRRRKRSVPLPVSVARSRMRASTVITERTSGTVNYRLVLRRPILVNPVLHRYRLVASRSENDLRCGLTRTATLRKIVPTSPGIFAKAHFSRHRLSQSRERISLTPSVSSYSINSRAASSFCRVSNWRGTKISASREAWRANVGPTARKICPNNSSIVGSGI